MQMINKINQNSSFNTTISFNNNNNNQSGYSQGQTGFPQNQYYNNSVPVQNNNMYSQVNTNHPAYGGRGQTIYTNFNMETPAPNQRAKNQLFIQFLCNNQAAFFKT